MRKYNKQAMAMYQKYGPGWDAPLFHSGTTTVESGPPRAPLFIDDATEEKATVYMGVVRTACTEEQRQKVLETIKKLKTATDNQIARELKTHPSTISARRNELRDQGLVVPVLDEFGKKIKIKDEVTNTPNTVWKVVL